MKFLISNSVPLNGGDEALLRATVESLQSRWPQCEITTLCSMPELSRARLPDLSIEPDFEFARDHNERDRVSELYRTADLVISAPGGFLNDFYSISERLLGFEVAIALGKPIVLFAQSIGPFWKQNSRKRIAGVLNRVSAICVRDAVSMRHLLECGVASSKIRQTADAAFLWCHLAPELFERKTGPVRSIALSFRDWPLGDQDEVQKTLAKAERLCCHLLTDPSRRLRFLSTCQGIDGYIDDSELASQLVERLPAELQKRCQIDRQRYSPRELIRQYSKCDAFIGMRLHGCLLSMLGGTPAMGLGYEKKTAEVFHQLGLDLYQLGFDSDADAWLNAADRFLQDIDGIRAVLPAALAEAAKRATRNLDCIEELLNANETIRRQPQSEWTQLTPKYDLPHLRLRQVAQLVGKLQPETLLDLGCSNGHLHKLCPGTRYIGCDFVAPTVAVEFPFYQCDFNRQELPVHLQELELIVCSGLLEYIDDLPSFLRQLRSRLKTEGRLIVTYFNMNHFSRIWGLIRGESFAVRSDWRGFYSPRDIGRVLEEAGFEITDSFAMNHSFRAPAPVEQTVDLPSGLRKRRSWSTLLSHQFLFVARPLPWDKLPLEQIESVVPAGSQFILVDEAQWSNTAFNNRQAIPFVERNGQYWGPPSDDEEAVREFERLRQATDVEFLVLGSPAFWWLDYYAKFALHLAAHFNCVLKNSQVIIFDLRTPKSLFPNGAELDRIETCGLQQQYG